jgi:hypothetical protein
MNDLEFILDVCLRQIQREGSSIEECLRQYPQHARELEPLLLSAQKLEQTGRLGAPEGLKATIRGRLMERARKPMPIRPGPPGIMWRAIAWLAILALVVSVSTTALAQGAMPANPLYDLKLKTEAVWRALAPDPVGVDLTLAGRRADELSASSLSPSDSTKVQEGFHDVLSRLKAEDNPGNGPRIEQTLRAHQEKLERAGIHDKELDDILHGKP